MRHLRTILPVAAALACALLIGAAPPAAIYIPQAQFCTPATHGPVTPSPLCAELPGNIGADPALGTRPQAGYKGVINALPTDAATDVQSPFDNYSWQTFVALNWTAGKTNLPAAQGLKADGPRVWETWDRVNRVFGNSPVQANCQVPPGYGLFSMGSNGRGQPTAQNEEYIQAATLKPAIDVDGNFTLYERRLNKIEIAYLKAPNGKKAWDLTTWAGQEAFINAGGTVNFPSAGGGVPNGAMEIKAAWRMLDPKRHAENVKRFYTIRAVIAVSPDLVNRGPDAIVAPICVKADLGLVAMHIIQKNPDPHNNLLPEWFWTTFEHVDNAPLASGACDVTKPGDCNMLNQYACPVTALPAGAPHYSYYNALTPGVQTNQPAQFVKGQSAFLWNGEMPFAKSYLTPAKAGGKTINVGTQISRCWQIYRLTRDLNKQWQAQLKAAGSVFANYMLVGTQWGANLEPSQKPMGPLNAAPNYLSNSVVETFLQTFYAPPKNPSPFQTGSCISCHSAATLAAGSNASANFSFLPGLASHGLVRSLPPSSAFTKPPPDDDDDEDDSGQ